MIIENSFIQNFDDAVAVKTSNQLSKYSPCSQNITIRNMVIHYSVGATIGSVTPHPSVSCIRNVTFQNVTFHEAIKAVYIKSNPGNHGTGIIDSIVYDNINVQGSIWYPIWIGLANCLPGSLLL